jgi:hypothetical protein
MAVLFSVRTMAALTLHGVISLLSGSHAFRPPREAILRMSAAGVGGYWDSRRNALLRDLQRRELELDELASREQAMMPMLGASAAEREKASYAMAMAAEARAQAAAADVARIAAITAAAAAPPAATPAPELSGAHAAPDPAGREEGGHAAMGGSAEAEADRVESGWRKLLQRERAASALALEVERAKHEVELQSTANFWLARVKQAQEEALRVCSAARDPGEGVPATGGKLVPDHDDAATGRAQPASDQEGMSTVSAEAVATLEAELFALEADYEAISDQCEVMRETLTLAGERLVQMQNEIDEEALAAEVRVAEDTIPVGGGGEKGIE